MIKGLLYADKVEIEKWCQNEIKINKEREENSEFLKNSQYVRTLEDYFKSEVEIRKERIKRLQQFAWQLRYAHVFWSVVTDKFKHRVFKNQKPFKDFKALKGFLVL